MKKKLLAIAIAASVAVPAMAQNVTLYGLVDVGYQNLTNTNAAGDSIASMGAGLHSTSRWGLRGTEDLGGGLRANFTLESTLANDQGVIGNGFNTATTAAAPTTNSSQKVFDRQASIGLSSGAWALDLGRINNALVAPVGAVTPQFFTFTGFDPNVGLIALGALPNSNGYGPTSAGAGCTPLTGTTALTAANCASILRQDDSARLTVTESGWTVAAHASLGSVAGSNTAAGTTGVSATGNLGPASVGLGYSRTENQAVNIDALSGLIAGISVPVGSVTLRASYGTQEGRDTLGKYVVTGFGGRMPITAAGSINLSYYNVSHTNTTDANREGGYNQYGAIYDHSLSKRTGLYAAAFQKTFNGGVSVFRAANLQTSDTALLAGIRHSF